MKTLILVLTSTLLLACNSCSPTPSPVPPPAPQPEPPIDVGPAPIDGGPSPVVDASVRAACANMAKAGCMEGQSSLCVGTMQKALNAGITVVPLDCLVGATPDKPSIRACGFVPCP